MLNKRKSRILALQVMYAFDLQSEENVYTIFDTIVKNGKYHPEIIAYARSLVGKTIENYERVNAIIKKHTVNWDIKRMATIDRNILRLAITEMQPVFNVPYKVVIDEAVEIAKLYSAHESCKFVNGVIDAIHSEISKTN